MAKDPSASFATRLRRAWLRQCPRCGARAFDTYFTMKTTCTTCGLHFEREPGYWVGALIVNTTIVFATFLVSLSLGLMLTWPDVPWTTLLIVLLVVNGLIPVVLYPQSKTIWSAMEMGWNPLEPQEVEQAADRVTG